MSLRKGLQIFRKKKDKDSGISDSFSNAQDESINSSLSNAQSASETSTIREMSDARFQELLDESRKWKSDWIDLGREEAEVDLLPILSKEKNILKLTNQLHPNQNQIKRLGTEISSIQIIPPAMVTLNSLLKTVREIREVGESDEIHTPLPPIEMPADHVLGSSILTTVEQMQKTEEEKLAKTESIAIPRNVTIDENQEINQENVDYEDFLTWLKQATNHELYVRIKQFVTTINETVPRETSGEREMQCEDLNITIRSFVKNALDTVELEETKRIQYTKFLRKFISVHCYTRIVSCLPSYREQRKDYFLNRCSALSKFITFQHLGHDNRHTVAQYKEFWDCAIEQLQVMTMYRFVDDKVVCLNNAVNILTRLLETIFKVVGADELMDGICIIVMRSQIPRLKLQLQMMDFFYEEKEEKRGMFESVKLRIRGIISFIKSCKYSDFTRLPPNIWNKYMGEEGKGLSRPRTLSEISSDDEMMIEETEEGGKEEVLSAQTSVPSETSQNKQTVKRMKKVFSMKTKRIVDGKWKECLDPMPEWTDSEKQDNEITKAWKAQRYLFYKKEPETEEEMQQLLTEYRNLVRTVENLLYLLRSCMYLLTNTIITHIPI